MSWDRWKPSKDQPWDLVRVVHLHRRAGFAPNWSTIESSLLAGVDGTIDQILNPADGATSQEFESMAKTIGDAAVGAENVDRLRAWWVYRMMMTPAPLIERMTLAWHNHFATSNEKVNNVGFMYRQNNLLRQHSLGKFGDLLKGVLRDPAMLVWLDATANRKEHPNENLAREVMELFTLGEGNYTEKDVAEGARCLTGWGMRGSQFSFNEHFHDAGSKTILGKTSTWNGENFLDILIDHPATPRRVAWRLCQNFFGEAGVEKGLLEELADGLRQRQLDLRWGVETILRSQLFFDDRNLRNRISSPVEYVLNAVRSLEMEKEPPSTMLLAIQLKELGQDLFHPPNVFGWPGGKSWIDTRSIIGRGNFATALLQGQMYQRTRPFDTSSLKAKLKVGSSRNELIQALGRLMAGVDDGVERYGDGSDVMTNEYEQIRIVLAKILQSPECQLI